MTIIRILPHLRVTQKGREAPRGSDPFEAIRVNQRTREVDTMPKTKADGECIHMLAWRHGRWVGDLITCIQCLVPYLSVEDILKDRKVHSDFKSHVNAKAIARDLRIEKIIPEAVETSIKTSQSSDEANNFLFEHLRSQAILEDLRRLCSIMEDAEGYGKMQRFGKELQAKLEEVR